MNKETALKATHLIFYLFNKRFNLIPPTTANVLDEDWPVFH